MSGRREHVRPLALSRATLAVFAIVAGAAVLAGCVTTQNPFPPPGSTPQAPGGATAATVSRVVAALAAKGIPAAESNRSYRRAEGPLLAAAPRTVVEASLPDDPDGGFILVYTLASTAAAQDAAEDHAAYLAAGIGGRSQYPAGTAFVVRVVGADVVFFSWLPASAADAGTATIAEALGTVGTGVQVPG
jgi:hypothetical protein